MGEKNIKNNEKKKKKKTDTTVGTSTVSIRPIMTQPELIKKKKKPM